MTAPSLTDFLLQRIEEDEAARWVLHDPFCASLRARDEALRIQGRMGGLPSYSAECDCSVPARVLADCEAKRRIVELHSDAIDEDAGGNRFSTGCAECGRAGYYGECVEWPCETIRILAAVYADHADYRDEWTP